jgi:hypothetical protein
MVSDSSFTLRYQTRGAKRRQRITPALCLCASVAIS